MRCHYLTALGGGAVVLLLFPVPVPPAWAQEWTPTFKSDAPAAVIVEPKRKRKIAQRRPARPKQEVSAATVSRAIHRLAIQVAENNPQVMNLALNNARNVVEYYKSKGEEIAVEIVTFGPGLHMLRDDTSPVKQRIAAMALETPSLTFIACANTQANMSKQENKPVPLIGEAKVIPSGVVRIMELKEKGYAYLRP